MRSTAVRVSRAAAAAALLLVGGASAHAQGGRPARPSPQATPDDPAVGVRAVVMVAKEYFAARNTFDAVFGQSDGTLVGGGAQVTLRSGLYFDVGASRFRKTGQRVFRANDQNFPLGIPLTATITPFEFTAGYRFRLRTGRARRSSRIIPYAGAGIGSYGYQESSEGEVAGESVDVRHTGYLVTGGAEIRVNRWVGVSADVAYTRVTGIIGENGISKDFGETNLGGTAVRFKVIVGR